MVTATTKGLSRSSHRQTGFSLLEMLLTLVVVGLIISVAGLSVNSGQRSYQVDAALMHFADIAEYALDESQLSGTDMGLLLERRSDRGATLFSFQWLQRAGSGWQVAPFDEDAYGRRDLPEGIDVLLEVEQDFAAVDTAEDAEESEEGAVQPQVVFYSSGETTPGIMTWVDDYSGEILWELEWDLFGRLSLRRQGIADEE